MTPTEIKLQIEGISIDSSMSLDERIDKILDMRANEKWDLNVDGECFKILIETIKSENAIASHVRELMQLYVLLAETYVKLNIFRPLDDLAFEVREILRDERIAWEVINETVPRIIDALKDSVYHHETYRLLLVYLDRAVKNGKLDKEMKGRARHLLKLRILLDDNYSWHDHLMKNKEMQEAIASLFTSEELLKIILNPTIGHLKCDPIEYSDRWEEIYYDVEDYLKERFANVPRQMGFCFMYWSAKMDYLKEKYNIEWHSPSQMNPQVMFD